MFSDDPKLCFPVFSYYAVVRMDPEAMLRTVKLDDEQALDEVRRMPEPKKYLVYLKYCSQLPMPDNEWLRFEISPIGTTLRPEVSEEGITADMVTPIAPNTEHPHGREPVVPAKPFPFKNCFHWVDNDASVRIKVRHEDPYDYAHAVGLSCREERRLSDSFNDDLNRIYAFSLLKHGPARSSTSESSVSPRAESRAGSTYSDDSSHSRTSSPSHSCADGQGFTTPSVSSESEIEDSTVIDPIFRSDIFGFGPVQGEGLFPILDCWFELDEHLTEDTIPSPALFFEEAEAIKSILHRAYDRKQLAGEDIPSSPPDIRQTSDHASVDATSLDIELSA